MTRSLIVSQEMKNGEELKDFKEEVRKTNKENNMILEELRSYMVKMMAEKLAKKKNKEASSGKSWKSLSQSRGQQSPLSAGNRVNLQTNSRDNRGLVPNPNIMLITEGMQSLLPKLELYNFIACRLLMDKADAWFHDWNKGEGHSWEEFERAICNGFGEQGLEEVIEEFNRNIAFKELSVRMERHIPKLKEGYFLSSFVGGLKDEIRLMRNRRRKREK
ncbi:hypothetical protein MANES_16G054026v8 [Manihot esculenta]|uniref:Uncharacterized protein n=1 Tax=Manihot esculenta TaxID=3983 RepID=A0ACB7G605_MANES|nr:hypothetical protein MANES_16G054026v8 [Manihot esculenta]